MKEHRHVIGIISGIEARNIDQRLPSEAVSKLSGIQCWVAIVGEVAGYAVLIGALDVCLSIIRWLDCVDDASKSCDEGEGGKNC